MSADDPKVEAGQLRRWKDTINKPQLAGRIFMVLCEGVDLAIINTWEYLMDGDRGWHFEAVILDYSEILSEAR